jgi:peroxiredoxin
MKAILRAAASAALLVCALPAADIPRPAPDFPIPIPGGKTLKTSEFKGKVVIVEFLLTTCPGCQAAARILSQMQTEFGTDKLQVIGVAVNKGAETLIGAFAQQYAPNFPIGVRDVDASRAFLQIPIMNRLTFPQMAFIDKNGVIRSQHGGEGDEAFFANEEASIRAEIKKYLAEKPAPPPARKK